jgi:hypothetical protein
VTVDKFTVLIRIRMDTGETVGALLGAFVRAGPGLRDVFYTEPGEFFRTRLGVGDFFCTRKWVGRTCPCHASSAGGTCPYANMEEKDETDEEADTEKGANKEEKEAGRELDKEANK